MKLKYKLLFIILLFLSIFILANNVSNAYSYNVSSYIGKLDYMPNCTYVVYRAQDNNIYLITNQRGSVSTPVRYFSYNEQYNHLIAAANYSSSSYGSHKIYLLNSGTVTLVESSFDYPDMRDSSFDKYKVKDIFYASHSICYIDNSSKLYYYQNRIPDLTKLEIEKLVLEMTIAEPVHASQISSVSDSPFFLRTQFFEWEDRTKYTLYYSYNNTDNFIDYFDNRAVENGDYSAENLRFCIVFEVEHYGTYYFKLLNNETNEFTDIVSYEVTSDTALLDTSVVSSDILPVPELYMTLIDDDIYVSTQWLSYEEYSNISLYYKNNTNTAIKTEYFMKSNSIIEHSDYNSNLFRFLFPILFTGEYEFVFVRDSYRSESNKIYVDMSNLNKNEFDISAIFDENIPALALGNLEAFSTEEVFLYSQWFTAAEPQYLIYFVDSNNSHYQKFTDYEIVTDNEGNWRYKLRFTYDSTYSFYLSYKMGNTLLYGEYSYYILDYFGQIAGIDNAKNDLYRLCEESFGFLFYPFTLFFDICAKFMNIKFSEPVISIPEIYVPLFENQEPLIPSSEINFNEIIENNSTFKTIHNLILICTDAFIVFSLVNLFKKKWSEVFG